MDLTEIDKVVSCIYARCDLENTDSVPVSNLLQVIEPFFVENMTQLEELQKQLDPNNSNPCISSAQFFEAMNQWASQIKNNDTLEIPQERFVNKEGSLAHSTPRPKDSYYNMLKSCSEIFNMSIASAGDDREMLEERVKQLQYEISTTTNELDEVKRQLSQACEQNEVLSSKLSEMTTNFTALKNTNDELQHYRLDHQEIKEELAATQLNCARMEIELNESSKTYKYALQEHAKLENKKLILEDQLEDLRNKDEVSTKIIVDLKVQLELRNAEITNLKSSVNKLTEELEEKKEIIADFEQLLESSRESLEKCLCKNVSEKARASPTLFSEIGENKNRYELNSPGLVQKIFIQSEIKPDKEKDNLLKQCLEKNIQPNADDELPKRHILDESLPVVFKNLPVLSPCRENSLETLSISEYTRPTEDTRSCCPTPRRAPKSLKDEFSEVRSTENHPTVPELEDEIERLKSRIKELEDLNKATEECSVRSEVEQKVAEQQEEEKDEVIEEIDEEEEEETKEVMHVSQMEQIWADVNESTDRIKEFVSILDESRIFPDFLLDQLFAIAANTDSTKENLEKLIKFLSYYSENVKERRERHQEWFDVRFEDYIASIHSLVTSFPASTSVPAVQDLSNVMVALAKLAGIKESEYTCLDCFKAILEHVVALDGHQDKVVTPLEDSHNAKEETEETKEDDADIEQSYPVDRNTFENPEDVKEAEISKAPLIVEESPCRRARPEKNWSKKNFLKVLLSLLMVLIFSIFYMQLVQWNCTRMARKVICPFDWLITKTVSGELF